MMKPADRFSAKKVCVVVPTYNNAPTLPSVLSGILKQTSHVIVVNDGSTDNTEKILSRFSGLEIAAYPKNVGKGFALQTGFRRAVDLGYDYAITIDSDGQHDPDDLVLFLDKLEAHPYSVIIGARNMDQAGVPGKSSFGNRFSNFWFRVNTGIVRSDTQSGYRLYPLRAMEGIRFRTKKFEFEIEVLVQAAWKGIEVTEVPVRVYYPEKGKRISHFRPFRDFVRISLLNTVLVTLALLYIKPRDFIRDIKKKNSGRSSGTSFSHRVKQTLRKRFRSGSAYLWE